MAKTQDVTEEQRRAGIILPDDWKRVARDFNDLYYGIQLPGGSAIWGSTNWFGIPALKTPTDMAIFQEIVTTTKPELIVECGVYMGGTAFFLWSLMSMVRSFYGTQSKIIGIDLTLEGLHPNVQSIARQCPNDLEFIEGDSTDDSVAGYVKSQAAGKRTMVILDSDHTSMHVMRELQHYAPLVTPGCYLVVEDTNLDAEGTLLAGNARANDFPNGGPGVALKHFLEQQPAERWLVDRWCERHLLTFNPGGYLRRCEQ